MATRPRSPELSVARCIHVAPSLFSTCNTSIPTLPCLTLYCCTLILKYSIKGYGYIRTHTYTHIHAHIMYFLFFVWLILEKCILRCNGATKPLKAKTGADFRGCILFHNHATNHP